MRTSRPSSQSSTNTRPLSRQATSGLHAVVDRAEVLHVEQMKREVETASSQIAIEEARDHHRQQIASRSLEASNFGLEHREEAMHRQQHHRQERVNPKTLSEDEFLLDERLHRAMEAKLGRLSYLKEHARVQRVFAAARNYMKRRDIEKQQQQTLAQLVAKQQSKGVHPINHSPSRQPGGKGCVSTTAASSSRQQNDQLEAPMDQATSDLFDSQDGLLSTTAASTDCLATKLQVSALAQRHAEQAARQRSVDAIIDHEERATHFYPTRTESASNVAGGRPHQARCTTPDTRHPEPLERPIKRPSGDPDLDWGGSGGGVPAANHHSASHNSSPMRPSSRQLSAGSRIASAGSTSSSHIGLTKPTPQHSLRKTPEGSHLVPLGSGSHNGSRSKLLLPPLPALIDPQQQRHLHLEHSGTIEHHQHVQVSQHPPPRAPTPAGVRATTPIVDPFPEENARAYRIVTSHQERSHRRPNSRGAEERRVFEKHSMNVLRDMILGASHSNISGSRSVSPNRSRQHRPPSSSSTTAEFHIATTAQLGNNGMLSLAQPVPVGSILPRTVRAASPSTELSAAVVGVCPPLTNNRGELDDFERVQTKVTKNHAQHWFRLFGSRRRVPPPPRRDIVVEAAPVAQEEEEEDYFPAGSGLGNDDDSSSCDGDADIEEPPSHERLVYEMVDMTLPKEFQDDHDTHHATNHRPSHPTRTTRDAAKIDTEANGEAAAVVMNRVGPPHTPQQYNEERRKLQAHHGGLGGDSPARGPRGGDASRAITQGRSNTADQQDQEQTHHATVSSMLPPVEPDFSFENFFAGGFESIAPDDAPADMHEVTSRRAVESLETNAPHRIKTVDNDGAADDEDPFPAPPQSSGRFADFGSDSSSDDDDVAMNRQQRKTSATNAGACDDDEEEYSADEDKDPSEALEQMAASNLKGSTTGATGERLARGCASSPEIPFPKTSAVEDEEYKDDDAYSSDDTQRAETPLPAAVTQSLHPVPAAASSSDSSVAEESAVPQEGVRPHAIPAESSAREVVDRNTTLPTASVEQPEPQRAVVTNHDVHTVVHEHVSSAAAPVENACRDASDALSVGEVCGSSVNAAAINNSPVAAAAESRVQAASSPGSQDFDVPQEGVLVAVETSCDALPTQLPPRDEDLQSEAEMLLSDVSNATDLPLPESTTTSESCEGEAPAPQFRFVDDTVATILASALECHINSEGSAPISDKDATLFDSDASPFSRKNIREDKLDDEASANRAWVAALIEASFANL